MIIAPIKAGKAKDRNPVLIFCSESNVWLGNHIRPIHSKKRAYSKLRNARATAGPMALGSLIFANIIVIPMRNPSRPMPKNLTPQPVLDVSP